MLPDICCHNSHGTQLQIYKHSALLLPPTTGTGTMVHMALALAIFFLVLGSTSTLPQTLPVMW